jgi:DNA-binding CsgD family transcriptional regulator
MSTATGLHYRTAHRWDLTPRQREVLDLIARGYTNAQIGNALNMSLDGAKFHVSEIIGKLGVANREDAARWWVDYNRPTNRVRRSFAFLSVGSLWKIGGVGAGLALAGVAVVVAVVVLRQDGGDTRESPALAEVLQPATPFSSGAFTAQPEADVWELDLRTDGTFLMSAGSGRFEGTYTLNGDHLTIDDRSFGSACEGSPAPGVYRWTQSPDSLSFVTIADTCSARSRFWGRTWYLR